MNQMKVKTALNFKSMEVSLDADLLCKLYTKWVISTAKEDKILSSNFEEHSQQSRLLWQMTEYKRQSQW